MEVINKSKILNVISATASFIDKRLISHGERVAFILYKMLEEENKYSRKEIMDICMLGVLHDIGAYKMEEVDRLIEFESTDVWDHSIYGYVFLNAVSPLKKICDAVLYHHLDYSELKNSSCKNKDIAEKINLADRIDILLMSKRHAEIEEILKSCVNTRFSEYNVQLFLNANFRLGIINCILKGEAVPEIRNIIGRFSYTYDQIKLYMELLVLFIDFRSEQTVFHTILTVTISREIARLMSLSPSQANKVSWGALFHDLGKIAIPVEILEKQGKLTEAEMEIMKSHVTYTKLILEPYINKEVLKISIRHHEKLDGSGYGEGLTGESLTTEQRIVAVADIVSALTGKRSYKEEFDEQTTINILRQMADMGKICPAITEVVINNYKNIMVLAKNSAASTLNTYLKFNQSYEDLKKRFTRY